MIINVGNTEQWKRTILISFDTQCVRLCFSYRAVLSVTVVGVFGLLRPSFFSFFLISHKVKLCQGSGGRE
jgi:hypothetical protein